MSSSNAKFGKIRRLLVLPSSILRSTHEIQNSRSSFDDIVGVR
jgi:hypothetical protein